MLRVLGLSQGRAGICKGVLLSCSCRQEEGEAVMDVTLLSGSERRKMSLRNVGVCSMVRNCGMNEWGEQEASKGRTL